MLFFRRLTSGWSLIFIGLMMAFGLAFLMIGMRVWQERIICNEFRARLAHCRDQDVPQILERLARFDELGLPVLTESLGSARDRVPQAAHQTLLRLLQRWEQLPSHVASRKRARLAALLVDSVAEYDEPSQGLAASLAHRLLLPQTDPRDTYGGELVAHCDALLGANRQVQQAAIRPEQDLARSDLSTLAVFQGHLDKSNGEPRRPISDSAERLADPWPDSPSPEDYDAQPFPAEKETVSESVGGANAAEPWELDAPNGTGTQTQETPPIRFTVPDDAEPLPRGGQFEGNRERGGDDPGDGSTGGNVPLQLSDSPDALFPQGRADGRNVESLSTIKVMHRLNRDPAEAQAAEAELTRRGFSATHLALAQRLTHPDPNVRKQLVNVLNSVPGLETRSWLLWLSQDADRDVRLAATTVMATSNDPGLLRRVEELARNDSDPRIAEIANRLLQRKRDARRR